MKAAICTRYGKSEFLKVKDIKKPVPKNDEVLIKNYATTITSGDVRIRAMIMPWFIKFFLRLYLGFSKPKKLLGIEFAGVVEDVGVDVKKFKKGDRVFGSTGFEVGTYAEYVCYSEDGVITKIPDDMKFNDVVSIFFGGNTALYFLEKGKIKKGDKILIYGASGAIGTAAVQLANYFGAEVTGVCSTKNLEFVKSLGAKKVLDYTKDRIYTKKYDFIFDTVGKSSFLDCIKSLKSNGYYLRAVHMNVMPLLMGLFVNLFTRKKVVGGVADENVERLEFLKKLLINKKFFPVIDKVYSFEKIADAHSYVEKGHKVGNVVIRIEK